MLFVHNGHGGETESHDLETQAYTRDTMRTLAYHTILYTYQLNRSNHALMVSKIR